MKKIEGNNTMLIVIFLIIILGFIVPVIFLPKSENINNEENKLIDEQINEDNLMKEQSSTTTKTGTSTNKGTTTKPSTSANKGTTTTKPNTNKGTTTTKPSTSTNKDTTTKSSTETTTNKKVSVTGVKLNISSGTLYSNSSNKTVNLVATISPSNATNKSLTWSSSNTNVASVDSSGKVTAKNPGKSTISVVTTDGKYKASYTLTVKKKVIIFITASAGKRMNDWFKSYTSIRKYNYSISSNTLKYVYKSGSGFDYQVGDGLESAKSFIKSNYDSIKSYVDINMFFTLTGNSVKNSTCNQITTSTLYNTYATNYNTAVNSVKNMGYNVKGFVVSHSPLQSKHSNASNYDIVYSTNAKACDAGYRSGWKYYLSNERMKSILKNNSNLTFVDNFSNFIVVADKNKKTFTWLRSYTTTDGLHWDQKTTIDYMTKLLEEAGM